ncbi:Site-specific recombinase XerC [Yersinia frederiksenii]|uniref:Site-specific recombinase XerC n=2 Tax=Yersinia frederiksenii TaxID=29484 RepID=A0A380PQI9_YERFR|nr:tyrosine-type recombinase/integrase [Yersinia frederiksenii]ATM95790.1 DUF3258 domain-containing protein [Yersinia frederiksenii]KGA44770.1 phage integrase family protein [Yersinia frederiksenii ATCC 33641]SUP75559.1 Site-specific recombinase XerC [Yersinia frederiksenii]
MDNKLVNNRPKFTTERNGIFYINFRLSNGTFFRMSLNTDSLRQCEVTMARLMPYIPLVQSDVMDVEEFTDHVKGIKKLTKADLDTYLYRLLEGDYVTAKESPLKLGIIAKKSTDDPTYRLSANATDNIESVQGQKSFYVNEYLDGAETVAKGFQFGFEQQGYSTKGMEYEIQEAAIKFSISQSMLSDAWTKYFAGDMTGYKQVLEAMKPEIPQQEISAIQTSMSAIPQSNSSDSTLLLSKAWDMYIADKGKKWSTPVAKENNRFFEVLLHVLGDKLVNTITKQHIRDALLVVKNLPSRNKIPYSRMILTECIEYDVAEEDLIASEHVHKHLKLWRSLFNTYLVDQKDILIKSPTDGISYSVKPNKGGHYSPEEMDTLKSYLNKLSKSDWRKMYFLTLAYTGARRSEIETVLKKHIRLDTKTGRYYIFIAGGKTVHAMRRVPIHKSIEAKLLERISTLSANDLVFHDLPDYTSISLAWIDIMDSLNIDTYDEFGLKRRLHGLRHTFISKAVVETSNHTLVQRVVGHSLTQNLGITARYTHRPPLKALLCVVDCIE